jgi:hypothetical protein
LLGLFVDPPRGFVKGRHHHVLQHLDVGGDFRVDLHGQNVLLAVHLDRHHASSGGGLHTDLRDLALEALLHLLRLLHHLLHVSGHLHGALLAGRRSIFEVSHGSHLAPREHSAEPLNLRV